ncbi:hypothetical protein, variant [Plasmodium yoelii 17X]|uniref:RNA-editing substrate-binding complex 6 protein domain-containing protein n=1 Tax=Plasmodium yoelii 17X TaxID=1323249 RepID=V7PN56_PLAYE|nr:hypothetical protein, variant [Plasmodium yoelii 17X]
MMIRNQCLKKIKTNYALRICLKNIKRYSTTKEKSYIDVQPNDVSFIDIKSIKNKEALKKFYLFYNKKKLSDIYSDYIFLINSQFKNTCDENEVKECTAILKYVANSITLIQFISSKKNYLNSGNSNGFSRYNETQPYYIHNIEKTNKYKEEHMIKIDEKNNLNSNYFFSNNLYKFISKLKKYDIWNYKEKCINKRYMNYHMLFPIVYQDLKKYEQTDNLHNDKNIYLLDCNIFSYYISKKNKNEFIDIIKKVNYNLLTPHDIKNILILLSILHHNNISLSNNKENIIKNNNHNNNGMNVIYKNKEYINKKIFIDIFNNIYNKYIFSKVNKISFYYLYDYILLMCINEVKNGEAYTNIVNVLSNYMNLINKISNKTQGETSETNILGDDNDIISYKDEKHFTNYTDSTSEINENSNDIFTEINLSNEETDCNYPILNKEHYIYIKKNLVKIKKKIINKLLLLYITKYVYNHIDNNLLYSHSDLICENLELIPHYMITNFIFTIGTCKYIDEFCMFMLAKYVQNNINLYNPNEIVIIVNTYADAALEDVNFYETICNYIKSNYKKFSSFDIIKILHAFSKVRIRDEELIKESYKKINNYLDNREKQYNVDKTLIYMTEKESISTSHCKMSQFDNNKINKRKNYILNKYLCAYALIAAGKLDYFNQLDKLFIHLKESIQNEGIDIRGILWMPIAITSFLCIENIFYFIPIYIDLIYNAFKKTQSPKLLSLLIRRHSILLHTIETDIIPKKYFSKDTINKLCFICKSKKDNSKEKVFVPDSSTFHIEVSNALLSLDIPHKKEVNIYPFTIDIFINTPQYFDKNKTKEIYEQTESVHNTFNKINSIKKSNKLVYDDDTNFEHTFENKKAKNKNKNKNEVYTDVPFV